MTSQDLPLETRRESYERILPETADRRREVLDLLRANPGGLTADELARKLCRQSYRIRPRVTELYKAGLVVAIGKRVSEDSGRMIAVWGVA